MNVQERRLLSLPIKRHEIEVVVENEIKSSGQFTNPVGMITRLPSGTYELNREVETGIGQYQEVRLRFSELTQAVSQYVQWIVDDFPTGEIDGLKISD